MDPLFAELADLFPDTVTLVAQTFDHQGAATPGASVDVKAHVIGKTMQVRDVKSGQLTVSTVQAVLFGAPGATVDHKYTLPVRFNPRSPKAIAVDHHTDESGAHHETVYF